MRIRRITLVFCTGLVVVLLLLFHFKQRDTYKCASCHSMQNIYQWRIGMWGSSSAPLSRKWEIFDETQLRQHLFPPAHKHEWEYFGGSPYHFFGTTWGGCALGSAKQPNLFCEWYELSPEFRGLIQIKLEEGQLSRGTIQRIVALRPWRYAEKSADAEVSSLIELAESLLKESGY